MERKAAAEGAGMRKIARRALVACLAMAALLLAGCAAGSQDERAGVDLPSGRLSYAPDVLSVVLDENATTGYAWTCAVEGSAVEPSLDEPLSAEDMGEADALAGAPAAHLFEFVPVGSGEAVVTLRYERSWETVEPAKTVVIRVTVEDGAISQVEAEERQSE